MKKRNPVKPFPPIHKPNQLIIYWSAEHKTLTKSIQDNVLHLRQNKIRCYSEKKYIYGPTIKKDSCEEIVRLLAEFNDVESFSIGIKEPPAKVKYG